MGNILRCFKGDDDGGDHYPYYKPTSRPHYQPPHYHGQPAAPPAPPQQQPLGPHGVTPSTVGVAALAHDLLNFESTSMVPDGLSQHVVSSRKAQVKWAFLNFTTFRSHHSPQHRQTTNHPRYQRACSLC
ncbi:Os12g0109200 [Oryza sativa Japonica Group]|uniref:Os12g0109200 protein n=1 Tax=Oryza sativa subsp. japonica TaxID=39947 RepID=A0A0P0Y615_ORYSJ|nr:hypothetical protein EE612_057364 [Oryza sativa]BAH95483.1 Os12g0109200 [Oryza sativa Japonica Group]BAT15535.1 Os12g0109200 [Oryza sativa Japonica Group]|eukprot:NP_001176755.1 Os12g0109200 [Oryza sativa Japonica Group]